MEIDLALDHPTGRPAPTATPEQGMPPSAAWTALDTACGEAGVRSSVPEPPAATPSVAPDRDTAATLGAAGPAAARRASAAGRRPQDR